MPLPASSTSGSENLGVYKASDVTVTGSGPGEGPERARWARASASLFYVLGFVPAHGRLLTSDDNRTEEPGVVVLGHDYWMRRFGGNAAVIGRRIEIEGYPLTIVGVLRRGADLPDATIDLWAPAHVDSTTMWNNHTWRAIGRLAPVFAAGLVLDATRGTQFLA